MRDIRKVPTALVVAAIATLILTSSAAADQPLPPADFTHQHANVVDAPPPDGSGGAAGESTVKSPSGPICSTAASTAANVAVSCEGTAPHNETAIAVDPTNPRHMLASANDYQLRLSSGGQINETIYSRAEVTFDGGRSWTTYPVDFQGYDFTGDPAVAFDADGNAYLSTLGFLISQGKSTGGVNPDILVARSADGGKTWTGPVRVASGSGNFDGVGTFNDKEYITAWGHGNVLVTWTQFNDGQKGSYISSPINSTVSHDGGVNWTKGVEISGSAPFCAGAPATPSTPNACNQDQVSVPVVSPDGSVYVAFESTRDKTTLRDQYLAVQLDPQTGQRIAGPFQVAALVDGTTDYPIDAGGRQTYQDSQFRSWSAGNIAADPTTPGHLAVTWSDMRNSTLPAPTDPYSTTTNSDVGVTQSFDGGRTWSALSIITRRGDQFMPWAAYDTAGRLRIGFFDRGYDAANHLYGYTLATESSPGTLNFGLTQLTTALSDPTQGDRWFSGQTVNSAFPHPTSFLGDYSGIATSPAGGVVALWTDLRSSVCFTTRCGAGEVAEYATSP